MAGLAPVMIAMACCPIYEQSLQVKEKATNTIRYLMVEKEMVPLNLKVGNVDQ